MIDAHGARNKRLLNVLLTVMAVAAVGCGAGGGAEDAPGVGEAAFTAEQAAMLIQAQFPEATLEVRTVNIDQQGRGVAVTSFDEQEVSFFFEPSADAWELEAVDFAGSFYYLRDLEQISATMLVMSELATALEQYRAANQTYPEGATAEALQALIPDLIAEHTQLHDAWEQDLDYESDGDDYTLISYGADQESGTRDDLILHSGEFVGAGGRQQ